jgi:hypothetical protein
MSWNCFDPAAMIMLERNTRRQIIRSPYSRQSARTLMIKIISINDVEETRLKKVGEYNCVGVADMRFVGCKNSSEERPMVSATTVPSIKFDCKFHLFIYQIK